MDKTKKILTAIVAGGFLLAAFFVFQDKSMTNKTETVVVGNEYSVEVPSDWNYQITPSNNLIVSNFSGNLTFQDRSSEQETARLRINRIEDVTRQEYVETVTSTFEEGEYTITESSISGHPTSTIEFSSRNAIYNIVESDNKIFSIVTHTFDENSTSLRDTLNNIVSTFTLLQ